LTSIRNPLILKIAFVIIRRLQKPHYSSKTKIIYQKNKKHNQKTPIRAWHYFSQGHSTTEFGVFCRPRQPIDKTRDYFFTAITIPTAITLL